MEGQRKEYCLEYLKARKKFRDFADSDDVLQGNDNILGRIGEAIAHSFLERQDRTPIVLNNQTEEGYDIICDNDKKQRISVKTITSENKSGGTTKINDKYDELILVSINDNFEVERLGHISRDNFLKGYSKSNRYKAKIPYFRKSMLDDNGLISKYGKLYLKKDLIEYELL